MRSRALLRRRRPCVLPLALALAAALVPVAAPPLLAAADPPALWPKEQREFLLDGPAWLLPEQERQALAEMAEPERAAFIERFLAADRLPGGTADQLATAISRRRELMWRTFFSPADVRSRLLFLRGAPAERVIVDCGEVFVPLELWSYDSGAPPAEDGQPVRDTLVVYRPGPGQQWKVWTPYDSKRALYTEELEYFLEQWEESNGKLFYAERFDLQMCGETKLIDRATGVNGLHEYRRGRPRAEGYLRYLEPPSDLASWVAEAIATPLPEGPLPLEAEPVRVDFPQRQGQRIVARFEVRLPGASELPTAPAEAVGTVSPDGEGEEIRLVVEGVVEEGARQLDEFRVRFVLPPPETGTPAVLLFGEPLRPEQNYLVRFRVTDEVSGRSVYLSEGFRVPSEPREAERPPVPERAVVALGEALAEETLQGADSLVLVPPSGDVVLALWRAEALVSGSRIAKVAFSVDGEVQLTDNRPPYSAELRLAQFPKEQVVRAEGIDRDGEQVAVDEVVLNQPRGAFAVRITDPPSGVSIPGGEDVEVAAQVVVPEGRRVKDVRWEIDGDELARVEHPPWIATVHTPIGNSLSYLSVTAALDDGQTSEDVRILNAPDFVEQVEVDLVELYAAVTDRDGHPVEGLTPDDFEVYVDGRKVDIERFEVTEELPLTVGIVVDSSGSMASSLGEATEAARDFLTHVIQLRDHAFSVGFASEPVLLMPPTSDVDAVADSLGRLRAVGWTALHDAVVTGLYYFRGFPGQRVMVLLSDGDDTKSKYGFREVLEYARRGGVSVYTIGLNVGLVGGARGKLQDLAAETGGRAFFISQAEELRSVYGWLSKELRSRYMIAVAPPGGSEQGYREVEVKVKRRGVNVRTARGIYH
jgi:Ca-activated chloride channel family protein